SAGAVEREDAKSLPGFFPGWEFQEVLREPRESSLFELSAEPLVIEDEPESLVAVAEKFRARLAEAYARAGEKSSGAPPERYFLGQAEWERIVAPLPRLRIEHLSVVRPGEATRTLLTQPT